MNIAPHVILMQVVPDREATEFPLGTSSQFWHLPPSDCKNTLVGKQDTGKASTGTGDLHNKYTICSEKYIRTIKEYYLS